MKFGMPKHLLVVLVFLAASAVESSAQEDRSRSKAVVVPETVMAARLSIMVAPKMPETAIRKRCSNALVMLKITVDQNGRVANVEILSGFEELRDSAVAAVKQWTYEPYKKYGHAVEVQTQVSIFYLGDGQSFPMYSPDGKGGVKGGDRIPLPSGCSPGPTIKHGTP